MTSMMKVASAALASAVLMAGAAAAKQCPPDAVRVGAVCVDKYEASVWEITPTNTALIRKVQKGKISSAADLAGATARGVTTDDFGTGCPDTGDGCLNVYAVSIPGTTPTRFVNWFQAAAACANAGKRLLTNQEWQVAAFGTPDPGTDDNASDCNINSMTNTLPEDPTNTGARTLCISDRGAFDMVGNLWEWVADWTELAPVCTNWDAAHGTDRSCVGGDGTNNLPGALLRGGFFNFGTNAGVFTVFASGGPALSNNHVGFRCAREL